MFPTLGLDQESQFPGDRCPNRQKGPSWPVEGASPRLLGNRSLLSAPPPSHSLTSRFPGAQEAPLRPASGSRQSRGNTGSFDTNAIKNPCPALDSRGT